jgi:hypothetical protein
MACADGMASLKSSPDLQGGTHASGTQSQSEELQILKFAAKTLGRHMALTLAVNWAQHRFLLLFCMRTNFPLNYQVTCPTVIETTSKSVRELWLQHVSA